MGRESAFNCNSATERKKKTNIPWENPWSLKTSREISGTTKLRQKKVPFLRRQKSGPVGRGFVRTEICVEHMRHDPKPKVIGEVPGGKAAKKKKGFKKK